MSDMPIKMCPGSLIGTETETHGTEPDSILKFRIVKSLGWSQKRNSDIPSLGTGTRIEMSQIRVEF